jgi:pimeloyl-ACP methyl ester carboxylesterase
VLVHGLASNARTWDGVAARLAALGHPVAAVDQRGHGRSDKPDTGYDFATVSADLAAVVAGLGWDRPLVAGQSWGGNVVLELAVRHPSVAGGIACVDGGTLEVARRFPSW